MPEEPDQETNIRCCRCNRALTNPDSRAKAKGYGPICTAKEVKDRMLAKEAAEATS